ncbi:MAG: N-glycosylase/DNA lyase [Minisyncoccia bacterium]
MKMESKENLKKLYKKLKPEIKKKIKEFKENLNKEKEDIFAELSFCILTPQSKAESCWQAIEILKKENLLFYGSEEEIIKKLKKVRFKRKKARYIIQARKVFENDLKNLIKNSKDIYFLREFLIEEIKGLGMKEASHFLRNIGRGQNIAILDRHVLKNLKEFGIIKRIPETLTKKRYLEIEKKFIKFSETLGIKPDEFDLLLWAKETGFVFK